MAEIDRIHPLLKLSSEFGHERSKYTAVLNNDETLFFSAKSNSFLIIHTNTTTIKKILMPW